jgi:hypothetical protein
VDEASTSVPKAQLGAPNSGPRVGPLLRHEIHHTPAGGATGLEFVEIYNPTAAAVSLDGWRLRGSVDYNFLPDQSIAAGGVLVVVPFASTDSAAVNAFRNAFGVPAAVPLIGPWSNDDHLGNTGRCILYRADTPPPGDPGYHPLTIEDQVSYSSAGTWPNTTAGFSLNRRGSLAWGDDSTSWKGNIPTPGSVLLSYTAWRAYYYPGGTADDADSDGDGATTLEEFGFGFDPLVWENHVLLGPVVTTEVVAGQTTYIFKFTKPLDRTATYTVEQSSDLQNWTPVADELVSSTADSEIRQASVPVPSEATKLFLRLKITAGE